MELKEIKKLADALNESVKQELVYFLQFKVSSKLTRPISCTLRKGKETSLNASPVNAAVKLNIVVLVSTKSD